MLALRAPRDYTVCMIESVARIRIELQGLEPKVWRRVDVPVASRLAALHDVIEIAVGWLTRRRG